MKLVIVARRRAGAVAAARRRAAARAAAAPPPRDAAAADAAGDGALRALRRAPAAQRGAARAAAACSAATRTGPRRARAAGAEMSAGCRAAIAAPPGRPPSAPARIRRRARSPGSAPLGVAGRRRRREDGWVDARRVAATTATGTAPTRRRPTRASCAPGAAHRQLRPVGAFQRIYGAFIGRACRARPGARCCRLVIGSAVRRRGRRCASGAGLHRLRGGRVQHVAAAAHAPRRRAAALARLRSPQWLATIGVDLVCLLGAARRFAGGRA